MATDPNDIRLTDEDRKLLARAEKERGKPWRSILREALGADVHETRSDDEIARMQRSSLIDLFERLDTLPVMSPDDGVCVSEDHDKILYGGK